MTKQQVEQKLNIIQDSIDRIVDCMYIDISILKDMLAIIYEEAHHAVNCPNKK